ncbi:MAG TPA: histidine phosphatase family protein, partial [Pirellulales bacterium]|nr:histidine phosphatase family protein [Pirellulales bacterium]
MILYLVRHAWAEDRDAERWPDDRHRPLTSKGIKRFGRVAKRLAKRGIEPKCVATSPLVRCVQTARILCERFELDEFAAIDELAPGANLQSVITAARRLESDEVA